MPKDHPSDPRPNRYAAKCCHCRKTVEPGKGLTAKVMGTTNRWDTYHSACEKKADDTVAAMM